MYPSRPYPRYLYPPSFLLGLVRDVLLQRPRRFQADARACIRELRPPLCLLGAERIPARGCFAITLNHYHRPGYASQWSALAISAALPADIRWIMTDELTFPGSWIASLGKPVSHFILGRISRIYDFTAMPPMPPRPQDVQRRAAAVRLTLRHVANARNAVLAIAPEGGDQPGGRLSMPPAGAGRFCLLLAAAGLRFLPVGVFEEDGALTLNFGLEYELGMPPADSPAEKDRRAARTVMSHIASLLPVELRGEFATA